MRYFRSFLLIGLVPALVILLSAPGCKSKKPVEDEGGGGLEVGSEGGSKETAPAKTELASMGYGQLSGTVTYEGDPPQVGTLKPQMEKHQDAKHCLAGKPDEIQEQSWVIGPNKGVADVVVFLKVPADKCFKIDDQDKTVKTPVELRQPHCAFLPHVVAVYPVYYDPAKKDFVKTGQLLKVINDAEMSHNTKISGDPNRGNEPINKTLLPGRNEEVFMNPQPKPLEITCNFHTWMTAKAWVFDNPYHAVTRGQGEKDKEADFGKYDVPRVPAGVKVNVVAWHPAAGFIWGEDGKEMTFKANEKNELNFSVKKK